MKAPISIGVLAMCLVMINGCALTTTLQKEEAPYGIPKCKGCNVLVISLDTLRADHLGAYGYYRNTSPTIDALAEQSIVFKNFFANAFFSFPAHMSLFTGLYPLHHQMLYPSHFPGSNSNLLDSAIPTIAEIFQENQYTTIWVSENTTYLDPSRGFERGFNRMYGPIFKKPMRKNQAMFAQEIFDDVLVSIGNNQFFWFFHTYAIHAPYITPEPYYSAFADRNYIGAFPQRFEDIWQIQMEKLETALEKNRTFVMEQLGLSESEAEYLIKIIKTNDTDSFGNFKPAHSEKTEGVIGFGTTVFYSEISNNPSQADIHQAKDTYDSGILFVDSLLKRLFDEMKVNGLWNNTIVVITSDHGEELFEHGNIGHKNFYEHTIHLPLIIHVPGMTSRLTITNLAQSVDVLPTILAIADVPLPKNIDGKDQIAILEGREPPLEATYGISFSKMYVRTKDWKYLQNADGSEEFYNLINDKEEKENLVGKENVSKILVELRGSLEEWIVR